MPPRLFSALLIFLTSLITLFPGIIPLLREHLQAHLSIGVKEYGLLLSIGMLPAAITTLFIGVLVDRYGAGHIAAWLLMAFSLSVLAIGFSTNYGIFLCATATLGASSGGLIVAVHTLITQLFPDAKRRMLSANLVVQYSGGVLLALLSERIIYLISDEIITLSSFLEGISTAIASIALLAAFFIHRSNVISIEEGGTVTREAGWNFIKTPVFYLVLAGAFLTAADSASSLWIPRVLASPSLGAQIIAPGLTVALFSLVYILVRSSLAVLPESGSQINLLIIPPILGSLVFAMGILSQDQFYYSVSYVAGGAFWGITYPVLLAILASDSPKRFGSFQSILLTGSNLIAFILVNLMGYLGDIYGEEVLSKSQLIPVAFFLLAAFFARIYIRSKRNS